MKAYKWDAMFDKIAVFVACAVVPLVLVWVTCAHGAPQENSTLACEGISNPDSRHFCRAIAGHDRLECELIKDGSLRTSCRAFATK